jgi:putative acetyltransferase
MKVIIRPMRDEDARAFVQVLNASIRGLPAHHYPPEVIEDWAPILEGDRAVSRTLANPDGEIRFIAEFDGQAVGIGALISASNQLRACYVAPEAARRGVGTALVRAIEHEARARGVSFLDLEASINAEAFYSRLGYESLGRGAHALRTGRLMTCVKMRKRL